MASPHLSDAEWKVMNAVWADPPATARRVLEALADETGWKYSTVKTMLERLAEKGALKTRMDGITSVYTPTMSQDQARRTALQGLAEKAFGGALGSMAHFFMEDERLSPAERRELERLLRARPKRGRRS